MRKKDTRKSHHLKNGEKKPQNPNKTNKMTKICSKKIFTLSTINKEIYRRKSAIIAFLLSYLLPVFFTNDNCSHNVSVFWARIPMIVIIRIEIYVDINSHKHTNTHTYTPNQKKTRIK